MFNELADADIDRVCEAILDFYGPPIPSDLSVWPSAARGGACSPHRQRPLVSILIPTFNRGELLATRTLPSVLRQTYPTGRPSSWATRARTTQRSGSPRSETRASGSINLKKRGVYPEDPLYSWMVAGTAPANRALELARGEWLAASTTTRSSRRITSSGSFAWRGRTDAEFVYGAADLQRSPTEWLRIGPPPAAAGNFMHSSFLYRSYLRFLRYDVAAWKQRIGGDSHLWSRMANLGVRYAFLDRVVCQSPLRPGEDLAGQRAAERRAAEANGARWRSRPTGYHIGCGRVPFRRLGQRRLGPRHLSRRRTYVWNLARGFPVPDRSCALIYSEHLLEHLKVEPGIALLEECLRVLKPGGMPAAIRDALARLPRGAALCRRLEEPGLADLAGPPVHPDRAEMVNIFFRWWGHEWLYDAEEFHRRLREAGLHRHPRRRVGRERGPELRGRETRKDSLLICEAIR